jgi:hypothetical protein
VSIVAKEEIRQRAEKQYKQEEKDDPVAAGFGSDWGVADRAARAAHAADARVYCFRVSRFRISHIRLNRTRSETARGAEAERVGAGEACLSLHKYIDVSRNRLRRHRLREFGHEVFSHKADELFCEVALDLFMGSSFDRLRVRVGGMDSETASRLALDVKGVFDSLIVERELQTRKFRGEAGGNVFLDLSLQFLACGRLERLDFRIARVGDESTFGFGLDAIGELRDETLQVHVPEL